MSLHEWSWVALLMQSVFAICFAATLKAKTSSILRKIVLIGGLLLFAHTIFRFAMAWTVTPFIIPSYKGVDKFSWIAGNIWCLGWYFLLYWTFCAVMTCGAIILSASRTENNSLMINPNSLAAKLITKYSNLTDQSNICNLSWSTGVWIILSALLYFFASIFAFLGGLIVFFFTGKQPFRCLQRLFDKVPPWFPWRTVTIKKIPVIPAGFDYLRMVPLDEDFCFFRTTGSLVVYRRPWQWLSDRNATGKAW